MNGGIDFDGINAAALRSGRSFVESLLPGGKFRSLEYIVKNPCRDDRRPGSFSINYRTGVWKDFASGDGGSDFVSLVAYVRGISQGDAARELAAKFGAPLLKPNGAAANSSPNGHNRKQHNGAPAELEEAAKIHLWGDDGPPAPADEIRRHVYAANRCPTRVKIKFRDGRYVNWYRVFSNGTPIGWRAKKPDDYTAIPYVSAALNPFDPELIADEILWPEGEKDVDSLSNLNFPAFTFGGGGDGLPDGIGPHLKGRRVVILADNDEPGRAHAEKKATVALTAGAASVKILHFPELSSGEDVSDFIAQGGTVEQLMARIEATPIWSPSASVPSPADGYRNALLSRCAAEIKPEKIEWLWPGRLARGKHTCIAGEPGTGKSQLTIAVIAALTTGGLWPCGEGRASTGNVIILSAEDGAADTITPRLMAAGADLTRVHIVSAVRNADGSRRTLNLQNDLELLERKISEIGNVCLVVVDPVSSYLGKTDSHKNSEVRGVLEPLSEMAERTRVAILSVTHFSKSGANSTTKALHRFIGSIAFTGAPRVALAVIEDVEQPGRLLLLHAKNNIAKAPQGLAFRVEQCFVDDGILASRISWETEPVAITANEALAADASSNRAVGNEAVEWLQELLAHSSLPAKQVRSEADAAGYSWATIRRAKKAAGVEAFREGGTADKGHWVWCLSAAVPGPETLRGSTNAYLAQ
jgi:hypothetical protein